jgi:hypothetical protein
VEEVSPMRTSVMGTGHLPDALDQDVSRTGCGAHAPAVR